MGINTPNIQEDTSFFKNHTVDFAKTKKQEWKELKNKMANKKQSKNRIVYYAVGIAATILFVLTFATTKVYKSAAGEQQYCTLPDGSKVKLNAASTLTYYPIAWYFSRRVTLEGEAFFEVEKGSKFAVISPNGKTTVLGTSFNVYARKDAYNVVCVTGKVQVQTQGKTANILPGEALLWDEQEKTLIQTEKEQEYLLAWTKQRLLFKGQPLREVFDALERQYNVYIAYYPNGERLQYSGNISLENSIEDNLSIVCKTFQKQWQQKAHNEKRRLFIIN